MRFKPKHQLDDERIATWFAWWPVTIGEETRWLERVRVRQVFMGCSMMGEPSHGPGAWVSVEFDPDVATPAEGSVPR